MAAIKMFDDIHQDRRQLLSLAAMGVAAAGPASIFPAYRVPTAASQTFRPFRINVSESDLVDPAPTGPACAGAGVTMFEGRFEPGAAPSAKEIVGGCTVTPLRSARGTTRHSAGLRKIEPTYDAIPMEMTNVDWVAAVGQVAASIAHEVCQPLSGILVNAGMCLGMLTTDPPNIDAARETAQRTIRDANRASHVIARLRAFFSKTEIRPELVDLNEIIREAIALVLTELQGNQLILRPELVENLPLVRGDHIQIQQVILNLLRNASDAMGAVSDHPRHLVIRTARAEPNGILVAIQDSGPGVEPASLERIFDAFYTTKPDGLGIGLSVSRAIIHAHGGKLWATNVEPRGAIFQFLLPVSIDAGL